MNHLQSVIRDKRGNEYTIAASDLDSENFRRFDIHFGRVPIGYANYHFEGSDVLYIDDWRIRNDAVLPAWFMCPFFSIPPLRWRTKNFRKRGIGTAAIKFLANYARSQSAKRIEGQMKPHDIAENPELPNSYRKWGFTVTGDKISLLL